MARELWIDEPFPGEGWRVREFVGDEIVTLATFPRREAAEQYVQELKVPLRSLSEEERGEACRPEVLPAPEEDVEEPGGWDAGQRPSPGGASSPTPVSQ